MVGGISTFVRLSVRSLIAGMLIKILYLKNLKCLTLIVVVLIQACSTYTERPYVDDYCGPLCRDSISIN
jgi:hypothetical protein